jgi:hypothetical protein
VPLTDAIALTGPSVPGWHGVVFGTLAGFKASGHSSNTVDTAPRSGAVSGSFPIKTTTDWTLAFTRLAHRPHGL